jgi:hypothetical protein
MTKEQEKIIRDWFETIKKNLPAGAEISSLREHRDGKTTIVYEYGKHENTYRDGKRHGQIEVTKDHITQINRENKLRELGL